LLPVLLEDLEGIAVGHGEVTDAPAYRKWEGYDRWPTGSL
jgi:hypothetical protein